MVNSISKSGVVHTGLKTGVAIIALAAMVTCGGALFAASKAKAATATSSFAVTATVLQSCIVLATPMIFGNYDPTSLTPTDATTELLVTCTNGTSYNVGLNAGGGSGASIASRKLSFGGSTLNYTLYRDSNRTNVWGTTVGTDTQIGTGTGLPVGHTVYGRMPALQAALPGVYTDTITVTVTY
ncbi:Csu type fimbrial protein [Oceanibaculum pacificum]|nr:spore coat U domain-containing protein [Oceanibaculum pacificum]